MRISCVSFVCVLKKAGRCCGSQTHESISHYTGIEPALTAPLKSDQIFAVIFLGAGEVLPLSEIDTRMNQIMLRLTEVVTTEPVQ